MMWYLSVTNFIRRLTRQPNFQTLPLVGGGPGDGQTRPVDLNDPPPQVPVKTPQGVSWYVLDVNALVYKWDEQSPKPPK